MEDYHLCYTCKNAEKTEAEGKDVIYVSFRCGLKASANDHRIVIRAPDTKHVIECPRYEKVNLFERIRRKLLL